MQFFKSSRPMKSEEMDIDPTKMKNLNREKKPSRKVDRQIQNIDVKFGDEGESSGCTLTFDYEDNEKDTNLVVQDGENAGDQVMEKLKEKHALLKSKIDATKSYKDVSRLEDSDNAPADTSIFQDKKEVAFQSISSIGGNDIKPSKSEIKTGGILKNNKSTIEENFVSLLDPVKDSIKIGLLKELEAAGPNDRQYGIKGLSANSHEFMMSFMKNFVVDPFYKLDIIVDPNEMFDDFEDEYIGELQEKESKRCFKRNKLLRDQVEKAVNEKEGDRIRKMKDNSINVYKFQPFVEEDCEQGDHEGSFNS